MVKAVDASDKESSCLPLVEHCLSHDTPFRYCLYARCVVANECSYTIGCSQQPMNTQGVIVNKDIALAAHERTGNRYDPDTLAIYEIGAHGIALNAYPSVSLPEEEILHCIRQILHWISSLPRATALFHVQGSPRPG